MTQDITRQRLVTEFIDRISAYDYMEEFRLLGLSKEKKRQEFIAQYRPLIILLWTQALDYVHKTKARRIMDLFMSRLYQRLAGSGSQTDYRRIRKGVTDFSEMCKEENGLVLIAARLVDNITGIKSGRGHRVKLLTTRIIQTLKDFVDEFSTLRIVEEGGDLFFEEPAITNRDLRPRKADEVAPVPEQSTDNSLSDTPVFPFALADELYDTLPPGTDRPEGPPEVEILAELPDEEDTQPLEGLVMAPAETDTQPVREGDGPKDTELPEAETVVVEAEPPSEEDTQPLAEEPIFEPDEGEGKTRLRQPPAAPVANMEMEVLPPLMEVESVSSRFVFTTLDKVIPPPRVPEGARHSKPASKPIDMSASQGFSSLFEDDYQGIKDIIEDDASAEASVDKRFAESTVDVEGFEIVSKADRRAHERVSAYSIQILLEEGLRELPVKDLSAGGIGVKHMGWRFDPGQSLVFDIIEGYRFVLKGVKARVVRADEEVVGCYFENIEPDQLTELVQRLKEEAGE